MMKQQLTTIALALSLVTFTMLSPVVYASDGEATAEKPEDSAENIITEGYTRPDDIKARIVSKKTGLSARHYESRNFDIFYIDAWLFNDDDHDGFYSSFDLSFDLDVDYGSASVFADIWIRPENGYYELLHTTDVFTIDGYGTHDEYHVSTDLIDDYPVGYYDILIELYDIEHSVTRPVAEANSFTHDALFALPLESRNRHSNHGSVGVSVHAAAGSFWFLLTPLGMLLGLRLRSAALRKSKLMQCNK